MRLQLIYLYDLFTICDYFIQLLTHDCRHLRPGGVLEHVELDFRPLSSETSQSSDSNIHHWTTKLHDAFREIGLPLEPPDAHCLLQKAGFEDIRHLHMTIPYSPRPGDDAQVKMASRWLNIAMGQGIVGMTMAAMKRSRGYTYEDVVGLTDEVKAELNTVASKKVSCTM